MAGGSLIKQNKIKRFNQIAIPHLDAAYNLAKWLTRNHQDAEDIVQESYMKAFRHFDGFRGADAKAWLLAIVRNTCYTWLKSKNNLQMEEFDEESGHGELLNQLSESVVNNSTPEQIMFQTVDRDLINQAMQELPIEFREVLVLREQEGFSYHEIAGIAGIPVGTVMSRLARARGLMRSLLAPHFRGEVSQ